MKYIKLSLQGFIIGIGKIIPGVSGAMFAMMFGVYERALKVISNLKKEEVVHGEKRLLFGIRHGNKLCGMGCYRYTIPTFKKKGKGYVGNS